MDASIRQLKADLSGYIRRAAAGEAVTVNVHNRPVARIVAIQSPAPLAQLRRMQGLQWSGGKPAGLPRGETMRRGVSLAAWVADDRR
jgi:prevent-host-death family protein